MSRLFNLIEQAIETASAFSSTTHSPAVNITGCSNISVEVDVTAASTPSMTIGLETSNNGTTWFALGSTQACTASGSFMLGATDPQCKFVRITYVVTTGTFTVSSSILGKGPN